jgi:hypothetical protein
MAQPVIDPALPADQTAVQVQAYWRSVVGESFAQARMKPLVVPYCFVACYLVPMLWLAIPHANRPWLYRARWPIMAAIVAFDVDLIRSRSSMTTAFAYAVGLLAAWGVVASATLLVWTRPQLEAARIVRRRRTHGRGSKAPSPHTAGEPASSALGVQNAASSVNIAKSSTPSSDDDEYEYIWESFPAHASLGARLSWAFDLTVNFRCAG